VAASSLQRAASRSKFKSHGNNTNGFFNINFHNWERKMIANASLQLLLKPTQAAKALAISPRTLWTLTKRGDVPCVRLGHSLRYDPDGLREFIRSASCRTDKKRVSSCHAKPQVI
jgi:hypothetical protein